MFRFFIPLVILSFGAVLFVGYIQPMQAEITRLNADIVTLANTQSQGGSKETIEQKIAELKDKQSQITRGDKERMNRLVPKREEFDLPAFINDMNNVAIQTDPNKKPLKNLAVTGDPKKDAFEGPYGEVKVSFSIEATYDEFREFVKGIELSEQLLDITSVTFTAPQTTNGKSTYTVSLTTYFAP